VFLGADQREPPPGARHVRRNGCERSASPWSPLKTVRRSPGSYSATWAATDSMTMSGNGMVLTLASVFGGPRYGTLP